MRFAFTVQRSKFRVGFDFLSGFGFHFIWFLVSPYPSFFLLNDNFALKTILEPEASRLGAGQAGWAALEPEAPASSRELSFVVFSDCVLTI